jgi:hypothetical protein
VATPQLQKVWPVFSRGATIEITSNFFDAFSHAQQPTGTPQVNISYTRASDNTAQSVIVAMTQNADGSWSGQWDSRGAAAGIVYYSVETPGSPPVSVEDGQFTLTGNPANRTTF